MTIKQFKTEILVLAIEQAELLCEMMTLEDIKIEPEQLRRNVATILAVLTETEDFLSDLVNNRSGSDT